MPPSARLAGAARRGLLWAVVVALALLQGYRVLDQAQGVAVTHPRARE